MILGSFLWLLLLLIRQINILWNFIDPLPEHLIPLGHSNLLLLIIRFIGTLLLLCSMRLWAEVWVDGIVELPIHRRILHGLFGFEVSVLEHVFTFHQARYRLVLFVWYQMRVFAHHGSFLWGLVVGEDRLARCQTLRCNMMLHTSSDGGGFWFCISYTVHRSHMVLTKLRSHVKAVLQVIKVLSLSFCLVVQLTALSVFVFVGCEPWLSSMLPLVTIDALIFNSNARSGS